MARQRAASISTIGEVLVIIIVPKGIAVSCHVCDSDSISSSHAHDDLMTSSAISDDESRSATVSPRVRPRFHLEQSSTSADETSSTASVYHQPRDDVTMETVSETPDDDSTDRSVVCCCH